MDVCVRCVLIVVFSVGSAVSFRSSVALAADSKGEILARSGDASIRQIGNTWVFATSKVEKQVALRNGHFSLVSFKNPATNHEYVQGPSDIFEFEIDGRKVTGQSQNWVLENVETEKVGQGELLLRIQIHDDSVEVSKNYLLYPEESIIQEWLDIKNISGHSLTLADPSFLHMHILQREVSQIDFSYMTGGMCFFGSWILKTQPLTAGFARNFDASDPPECLAGGRCGDWTAGTSIYAPIQVYFDRKAKDGVLVGWDYMGRWASLVGNYEGGPVNVTLKVSGYKKMVPQGDSVETPKAFTGTFEGDLDAMGNQLLDYQYRYKWDYTRQEYFPAIQMLGYWWNGATDFDPKHPGEDVEPISTFRKIFRMADIMRHVGADIYWRDYGWWDIAGDWNGPDFQETGRYLAKYGMRQTIYTIVYDAEQGSKVVTDHPDWTVLRGDHFAGQYSLDQSKPGVTEWELNVLNEEVRQWGDFQWRKDDRPLFVSGGDYTPMLAQDQNFRQLLRNFLDQNPGNSFHGCNGGGNDIGYEALRMATAWQYSDGCVGRYRVYYTSYLFPPDKLVNMPDNWDPAKYNKEEWRGLLWSSFPMTGDTLDPDKLEGLRTLIDIYHYLATEGVVGRWVKVYHPPVTGDTPDWYLQRMSRDNRKGIIMPGHAIKSPIRIFPRGLLPTEKYNVSYQESQATQDRSGSDLMSNGISFQTVPDGELIYLNLPMHPGSGADKIPPTAPSHVVKGIGTNMGYAGVELTWLPGTDNNWISYYQVYRNGVAIDKVSKGTYYFDHSAGADLAVRYDVATVDGSGNASERVEAQGETKAQNLVLDDASRDLKYSGSGWKHEATVPAVFEGTQSETRQLGDAVEYSFQGNRITWYGRLGSAMGKADVFIDGTLDQTVDTYDADEIPNVAVYSRTFPSVGEHGLKILARGDHNWRSSDSWVLIDALQIGKSQREVIEDTPGKGVEYGGSGWKHSQGWSRASGGSVSWTDGTGDTAEFSFFGDGITWVGKLCPLCGIADVYVDDKMQTRVDTYAPDFHRFRTDDQGGWQVDVFEKSWPEPGRHRIRLVVTNLKNMLSQGHMIYLDSLQVSGQ